MKKVVFIVLGIVGVLFLIGLVAVILDPEAQESFEKGQDAAKSVVQKTEPTPTIEVQTTQTPNPTKSTEIVYSLSTELSVDGKKIMVKGKSSLPDYSLLDVKAMRIIVFQGESKENATLEGAGSSKASVFNGEFNTTVSPIDDTFNSYRQSAGETIQKVVPEIEVVTTFNPKRTQPSQKAEVLSVIGSNGDKLQSSPQLYVVGSKTNNPYNQLQLKQRISYPLP